MPYKDPKRQKDAQHKNYVDNKVKYKRWSTQNKALRAYLIHNLKKKTPCAVCGLLDPVCICFHHKHPSQKRDTITRMVLS